MWGRSVEPAAPSAERADPTRVAAVLRIFSRLVAASVDAGGVDPVVVLGGAPEEALRVRADEQSRRWQRGEESSRRRRWSVAPGQVPEGPARRRRRRRRESAARTAGVPTLTPRTRPQHRDQLGRADGDGHERGDVRDGREGGADAADDGVKALSANLRPMSDLLVRAARGERTQRPPVWLMRQAGRYIPEYREIRSEYTFLEAIRDPAVAERITLLPWDRFEPDGLVMYSDILVALEPLGFDYHIESGVGPVVENPVTGPDLAERPREDVAETLDYVGRLLDRLDDTVGDDAAVIGFAGGPFTLASYAVAGEPSRNHVPVRRFRAEHPDAFRTLLDAIADVVREFLEFQIARGADVVQLFDTYAGLLGPADYREFVLPLHRRILDGLDAPTIVFVRNMNGRLDALRESGADVVGLDWTVDVADARARLGDVPVQGNLDPSHLYGDPADVRRRTRDVIAKAGDAGHILNLGHGVDKDTPVENVRAFVETAKGVER